MKTEAVHAWFMERDHQENALYVFFFHFGGITKIWFLTLSFFLHVLISYFN